MNRITSILASAVLFLFAQAGFSPSTSDAAASAPSANHLGWTRPQAISAYPVWAMQCPSSSFCRGLDSNGDMVEFDGAAWTTHHMAEPLQYISCPSVANCIALNHSSYIKLAGLTWSNPAPLPTGTGWWDGVSCTSSRFCMAVSYNGFASTFDGTTWTAPTEVAAVPAEGSALYVVSCGSPTFCFAGGSLGGGNFIFERDHWTPAAIDAAGTARCYSSTRCEVTGGWDTSYSLNSGEWSSHSFATSPYSVSLTLDCGRTGFCVALTRTGELWHKTLNSDWVRDSQNIVSRSDMTGASSFVSCFDSSFCLAVYSNGTIVTIGFGQTLQNSAPQFTQSPSDPIWAQGDDPVDFSVAARDPDGDATTLAISRSSPTQPTSVICDNRASAPGEALLTCVATARTSVGDSFFLTVTATDNYGASASVTVTFLASSSPVVTQVRMPEVTVVRYIHSFSVPGCAASLQAVGIGINGGATAACAAIESTHNPVPVETLDSSQASFDAFLQTNEFRSITRVASFDITCTNGLVTGRSSLAAFRSFGATPIRIPGNTRYIPGQPYTQNPTYSSADPSVSTSSDNTAVQLSYKNGVAASAYESYGNRLFGNILPFVWVNLSETVSCDGGTSLTLDYSLTPTTMLFRDGQLVFTRAQTSDWGPFIASGGPRLQRPGRGNLDPYCNRVAFTGASLAARGQCKGP